MVTWIRLSWDRSSAASATYHGRFRRAAEMYVEHLANPAGWKPPKGRSARKPKLANGKEAAASAVSLTSAVAAPSIGGPTPPPENQLITYPFPLRSGTTAYFQLPRERPRAEVDRMVGFLQSLAIGPQPALPRGSDE